MTGDTQPAETQVGTIDLTPTTEGYANMARMFAEAVVNDATDERRHDTGKLLGSLIEIVAYLAHNKDVPAAVVIELVNDIKRGADRPRCDRPPTAEEEEDSDTVRESLHFIIRTFRLAARSTPANLRRAIEDAERQHGDGR
jgi:hypothetical protein